MYYYYNSDSSRPLWIIHLSLLQRIIRLLVDIKLQCMLLNELGWELVVCLFSILTKAEQICHKKYLIC